MESPNPKVSVDLRGRTFRYSLSVIKFTDTLPRDTATQIITRQLLRSATSIGANIIEAQAASSRKDFTNFLTYSLKSANESVYWLSLLKESGKVNGDNIGTVLNETKELAKILGASVVTLRGKNKV